VHTTPNGGLPEAALCQISILAFFTNAGNFHNYIKSTRNIQVKVSVKVKSKVVPLHAINTQVRVAVYLHSFLIWALHGVEW
jgi:hypothetical protein